MRFEFRAVGSSQNVSMVNTVLGAIVADQFKVMADRVESGEAAVAVAQDLLKQHMKVVFNGNGYAEEWPAEAEAKGLFVIPSNVDAICCLSAPKNVEMFEGIKVCSATRTQRPTTAPPAPFGRVRLAVFLPVCASLIVVYCVNRCTRRRSARHECR